MRIYQDDIERFLNITKRFQVKGLQNNEMMCKEEPQDVYELAREEIKSNCNPSEKYLEETTQLQQLQNQWKLHLQSQNFETLSLIDRMSDGNFKCKVCGKMSTEKVLRFRLPNMRRHVEIHMEGLTYSCSVCNKTFRSKNALSTHKSVKHSSKSIE